MGDLFWNKILGAVLGSCLVLFLVNEAAHVFYHSEHGSGGGYPIAIAETETVAEAVGDAGPPDFGSLLQNASVDAGARVARKCTACHVFEKGGRDATGPHLWDVMGRTAGAVAGFGYSSAMREYGQPWSYQNMYDYLENPRAYVPGTAMSFAGLKEQEERIAIIAYLRSLSDNPIPLPAPLALLETPAAAADVVTEAAAPVVEAAPTDPAAAPAPAESAALPPEAVPDAAAPVAAAVDAVVETVQESAPPAAPAPAPAPEPAPATPGGGR